MTALYREAAFFMPGHECYSLLIVAPSDIDRLISAYRIAQTALYRDSALPRPPYWETPTIAPPVVR